MQSFSFRTSNVTNANACLEVIAHATKPCRIREIEISLVTAAATVLGLGRPAATGITPTSPLTVLPEDVGLVAGGTTGAVAWGTGPTVPANFIRRVSFGATIGERVTWTWERNEDLVVVPSASIVLWNLLGGATLDVTIRVDERVRT